MDFLKWTSIVGETPTSYGWFHLMFIFYTIVVSFIIVVKGKNNKSSTIDKVVFGFGLFLLIIEIYKQLFFTYIIYDGNYPWYIFPYQFCSIPMYACLITPFIKNLKVKEALLCFIAFYGFLAGLIVMIYPNDVFMHYISISLHTMFWHSSMVLVGIYIITSKNYGFKISEVKQGFYVYFAFVVSAIMINIISFKLYFEVNQIEGFNLFFIHPFKSTHLPIFVVIQNEYGYLPLLVSYILSFTLGASFIWLIARLLRSTKTVMIAYQKAFSH